MEDRLHLFKIFAVIGGRDFADEQFLFETLDKYPIVEIVSGGAKGADRIAKSYALSKKIDYTEFLPDYEKYGRAAPLKRNEKIISYAEAVIAFWDGQSRGTKNALNHANKLNKPTVIYNY